LHVLTLFPYPPIIPNDQEGDSGNKTGNAAEERQDTKPTTASQLVEDLKPSKWVQYWGYQSETVEVEVSADSSLRIHDSSRSFRPSINPDRPSVHEEAMEMLTAALLIYIFADLRAMAREGVINAKDLLQDPITISQVINAISEHKQALAQRAIDHEGVGQRLTALQEIHDQQQRNQSMDGFTMMFSLMMKDATGPTAGTRKESSLTCFHDEISTNGVVYGIAVNHLRKRVTVVFRGSVSRQDWITDSKSAQKKVNNPVVSLLPGKAPEKIGIHSGFYEYLFSKDKEGIQRMEHILMDAKKLMKENPGYGFYCTGHSLGGKLHCACDRMRNFEIALLTPSVSRTFFFIGALATLCGFFAAIDDVIVQEFPVVVVSIASPQVGCGAFCDAFHSLERSRRLQHLRVSNKEDVITHLPFLTLKATAFSPLLAAVFGPGNLYKHCGVQLELKSVAEESETKTENYFVCHSRGNREIIDSISEEFKRSIAAARLLAESMRPVTSGDFDALTCFHSCREYEARLMACKENLSRVTLNELYQDEAIVGATLARDIAD
jgi:Lipase (class 3)